MKLKYDEINDQKFQDGFKDVDLTNWYEFGVILILGTAGNILLYKIFEKIQNLYQWKQEDPKNNPSKMLTVNFLLVITLLCFLFSEMWDWNCESQIQSLTMSPQIYVIVQICQAQTLNITFCFCSNMWLKLWRMKLRIDNRQTLLALTNILQIFLNCLIVIIPTLTIVSLILQPYISNIREYCLGALTILSTVSFAFICVILYNKLKDQYSVGDQYRSKLKYLSIGLITCALLRPSFNLLFSQTIFWKLKKGTECPYLNIQEIRLPDEGPTWAIFQFVYSIITDFIPIYILSLLFSPTLKKRKPLVNAAEEWDSGLE